MSRAGPCQAKRGLKRKRNLGKDSSWNRFVILIPLQRPCLSLVPAWATSSHLSELPAFILCWKCFRKSFAGGIRKPGISCNEVSFTCSSCRIFRLAFLEVDLCVSWEGCWVCVSHELEIWFRAVPLWRGEWDIYDLPLCRVTIPSASQSSPLCWFLQTGTSCERDLTKHNHTWWEGALTCCCKLKVVFVSISPDQLIWVSHPSL